MSAQQQRTSQKRERSAPTPRFADVVYGSNRSPTDAPSTDNQEGKTVGYARRNTRRSLSGARGQNSLRISTQEFTDWIQLQAQRYSEKDLAEITGLSIAAAQNLRQGRSGAIGATLATWCTNDPVFRANFHFYCGGYSETDPEFQHGLALLMNSLARRAPDQ